MAPNPPIQNRQSKIQNERRFSLDPQRAAEASAGIVRFCAVVIRENGVEAAIAEQGAAELSDLRGRLHPTRRLCIELRQASVALEIPLPSTARCPSRLPCRSRCLSVCVLSATRVRQGRNTRFCGLWDFPRHSHKKCMRRSVSRGRQRPVRRPCVPFREVTRVSPRSLPVLFALATRPAPCGAAGVSQNGLSRCRAVLHLLLATIPVLHAWRRLS